MIDVKNITKEYGTKKAVDNVSFKAENGEILGFLGPNGAGKTTTMNIITGYMSATGGRVLIDGCDVVRDSLACKAKIGYLPEQPPLYMNMTVNEYLGFVYDIKKVKNNKSISEDKKTHIRKISELVKIDTVCGSLIKNLSKGYKQRVGIAQALIGNPEILILDEPTVGLDPKQILEIRSVIKELGENRTVIVSSHILSEISAICDRVLIINKGKILAEDTPDNLSKKLENQSRFTARIEGERNAVESVLENIPGIVSYTYSGVNEENTADYIIEAASSTDIRKPLFKALAEKDMALLMLNPAELSLEDIFIELTDKNISLMNKSDEEPTAMDNIEKDSGVEENK